MGIFSGLEERAAPGPADDFWYEPISRYDDEDVTPMSALGQSPVWAAVNLIKIVPIVCTICYAGNPTAFRQQSSLSKWAKAICVCEATFFVG